MDQLALASAPKDLLSTFLAGRSASTLDAYRRDVLAFAAFVGTNASDATTGLLAHGNGPANEVAHKWRASMLEAKLSPASVNRRLAALRSFVKLARTLGMVTWELDVASVKSEAYRDTKGPGKAGVRRLLASVPTTVKAVRDRAMVRLMADMALRRGELVSLDIEHVDVDGGTVAVLGKGKTERTKLTAPESTRLALAEWLRVRPEGGEAFFIALDNASYGHRLTGRAVHKIVGAMGEAAGVAVKPHGLRHAAITEALEQTNGNVRDVQQFSRHVDVRTVQRYDDRRADVGGKLASLVSEW